MHAIRSRYLGPTNNRKARVSVWNFQMRITVKYDHALSESANHIAAAKKLAQMCEQRGAYSCGQLSDGTYAHVFIGGTTYGVSE